jgi:hypothetical protein
MKTTLLLLTLTFSGISHADTISLKGGESIYIGGNIVKCEGSGNTNSGYEQYADMGWSKLRVLLLDGLGSCEIRRTSGSNPLDFFYSLNFNGLHINRNSMGIIRNDIRNGGCE